MLLLKFLFLMSAAGLFCGAVVMLFLDLRTSSGEGTCYDGARCPAWPS